MTFSLISNKLKKPEKKGGIPFMEKHYLKELLNDRKRSIEVMNTTTAKIYYLPDNDQILKVFKPAYLTLC